MGFGAILTSTLSELGKHCMVLSRGATGSEGGSGGRIPGRMEARRLTLYPMLVMSTAIILLFKFHCA